MFVHEVFSITQLTRREGLTATDIAITEYLYDELNRVHSISHKKPDSTEIVNHSYEYDAASNILRYLNSIDNDTDYTYDSTHQLTSASSSNVLTTDESYTYDANGNRVTANGSSYITGLNNQLLDDGRYTYTYDSEGNRISKVNKETGDRELYEYDHRNRLIRITSQRYDATLEGYVHIQIVEYAYDFNNVWVRKLIDTNSNGAFDEKTLFIPEGYQTALQIENTDLTGNTSDTVTHTYLWTPDTQDKLLADSTNNGTLWTLTDHLGSVRDILQLTSTGIENISHIVYDAYGNVISGENPVLFGYTGKAFDISTNLQNNINRWYDATIGRWLTTDLISFVAGDTNLYRYVGNCATTLLDLQGLSESRVNTQDCLCCSGSGVDAASKPEKVQKWEWSKVIMILMESEEGKKVAIDISNKIKEKKMILSSIDKIKAVGKIDGKVVRIQEGWDGWKESNKHGIPIIYLPRSRSDAQVASFLYHEWRHTEGDNEKDAYTKQVKFVLSYRTINFEIFQKLLETLPEKSYTFTPAPGCKEASATCECKYDPNEAGIGEHIEKFYKIEGKTISWNILILPELHSRGENDNFQKAIKPYMEQPKQPQGKK